MKTFRLLLLYIFFVLLMLAALPFLLLSGKEQNEPAPEDNSPVIKIENSSGEIYQDTLEHFVMGVVAAEMPRSFPQEALKAQAIAARTYIYSQLGKGLFNGADTCTDPKKAQAWLDIDAVLASSTGKTDDGWQNIITAVMSTTGIIITYQGQVVSTTYCSTCGGQTASAEEVWGKPKPWLVSTECPYDQDSPKYETKAAFSLDDLARRLEADMTDIGCMDIKKITASGRVAEVGIGEKTYSGQYIRKALELNSTNFTFEINDNAVTFTVHGYGHGVGLCQYGAKGFAENGLSYEDILKHYYHGIELIKAY